MRLHIAIIQPGTPIDDELSLLQTQLRSGSSMVFMMPIFGSCYPSQAQLCQVHMPYLPHEVQSSVLPACNAASAWVEALGAAFVVVLLCVCCVAMRVMLVMGRGRAGGKRLKAGLKAYGGAHLKLAQLSEDNSEVEDFLASDNDSAPANSPPVKGVRVKSSAVSVERPR